MKEKQFKKLTRLKMGPTRIISVPKSVLEYAVGKENIRKDLEGEFILEDKKVVLNIRVVEFQPEIEIPDKAITMPVQDG